MVGDGDEVRLVCEVKSSTPITEIFWSKNTEAIQGARDIKTSFDGTVARLHIVDVFVDDAGDYACTAKNSHGQGKTSAKLTVKGQYRLYTH